MSTRARVHNPHISIQPHCVGCGHPAGRVNRCKERLVRTFCRNGHLSSDLDVLLRFGRCRVVPTLPARIKLLLATDRNDRASLRAMTADSDGSTTTLRLARDALMTPMVRILCSEASVSPSSRASAEGGSCHRGPSYSHACLPR